MFKAVPASESYFIATEMQGFVRKNWTNFLEKLIQKLVYRFIADVKNS